MSYVAAERIEWDDEAAAHIRTRSDRYPGDTDIDPDWTVEAVNDPQRIVDEPDPKSRHLNSVRTTGYSQAAQMVITVVTLRDARGIQHGAAACKTRGAALRQYRSHQAEPDEGEQADD
jgi:hypothetical protein